MDITAKRRLPVAEELHKGEGLFCSTQLHKKKKFTAVLSKVASLCLAQLLFL